MRQFFIFGTICIWCQENLAEEVYPLEPKNVKAQAPDEIGEGSWEGIMTKNIMSR